jgi:hypothetical protein
MLCDAYNKWIDRHKSIDTNSIDQIYDLEWRFYQCLIRSIIGMFIFVFIVAIWHRSKRRQLIESTLSGFYGNIYQHETTIKRKIFG